MQSTWILVADRARARLFAANDAGDALNELQDFVNPDGRKPGEVYNYDRKPRAMDSMGPARHAIEPKTTPEEKVATRFAQQLNDVLERGRVDHRYERLILAAAPRFLGVLKNALGKEVRAHVVAQVDKDLSVLSAGEIHEHLASQLRH